MAIFIRRHIQTALERLADKLHPQQIQDLVKRLNGKASDSLAAEWEAMILAAFCQCGRVKHEQNHGGETRPDILFKFGAAGNLEFLTDVRMVSDKSLHESNPSDNFSRAISNFLRRHGHNSAGLNIDVKHIAKGDFGKRKIHLLLPPKDEIEAFVEKELGVFLSELANNPEKSQSFKYEKNEISFSIFYNAREKQFSGGHHISYTVPYSMRNPLTNALISKGGQLAKSGYPGLKGIIICDGGCDSLNERNETHGTYGCKKIIQRYLDGHAFIGWILVIRIEQLHSAIRREVRIKATLHWNNKCDKPLYRDTAHAIDRMLSHLPAPEATPINAHHWLNGPKKASGKSIGYSMQGNIIKISARALTELLAGKIDQKQFLEEHGFEPHPNNPKAFSYNFFAGQISNGKTLQNAFVEKKYDKDDDWIVLEYDGPDAAIGPFRAPM